MCLVKVDDYEVREGLYYSKEWFWVLLEDGKARMGITDFAQKQLREVVFVDLPDAGTAIGKGTPFGTVESVKAVSDLASPLSGTIEEVNEEVRSKPELLNEDPYGKGWIIVVSPTKLDVELKELMDFDKSVEWHKAGAKKD